MSDFRRRLQAAEEAIARQTDTLRLIDGQVVTLPPLSWLDLAGGAIDQLAAEYEGFEPPQLTEQQERTRAVYAQAQTEQLPLGEKIVAEWARE